MQFNIPMLGIKDSFMHGSADLAEKYTTAFVDLY